MFLGWCNPSGDLASRGVGSAPTKNGMMGDTGQCNGGGGTVDWAKCGWIRVVVGGGGW